MRKENAENIDSTYGDGSTQDRKIACEEAQEDGDSLQQEDEEGDHREEESDEQPELPPDFPPESFWLSKDAEFDWFDRNAFYDRKDSTKGTSNSANLNPNLNQASNSNSQRFSLNLKSKRSIIGFPKPQKTNYVDTKNRRNLRPGNTRLFPKRSGSTGKSETSFFEPTSPKVSCMGRVRSKRDRNRRLRNRHRSSEPASVKEKTVERSKSSTGFFTSTFRAIFRTGHKRQPAAAKVPGFEASASPVQDSSQRKSVTKRVHESTLSDPGSAASESGSRKGYESDQPPGLGGMKRFVSGRRSDSWEAGIDVA